MKIDVDYNPNEDNRGGDGKFEDVERDNDLYTEIQNDPDPIPTVQPQEKEPSVLGIIGSQAKSALLPGLDRIVSAGSELSKQLDDEEIYVPRWAPQSVEEYKKPEGIKPSTHFGIEFVNSIDPSITEEISSKYEMEDKLLPKHIEPIVDALHTATGIKLQDVENLTVGEIYSILAKEKNSRELAKEHTQLEQLPFYLSIVPEAALGLEDFAIRAATLDPVALGAIAAGEVVSKASGVVLGKIATSSMSGIKYYGAKLGVDLAAVTANMLAFTELDVTHQYHTYGKHVEGNINPLTMEAQQQLLSSFISPHTFGAIALFTVPHYLSSTKQIQQMRAQKGASIAYLKNKEALRATTDTGDFMNSLELSVMKDVSLNSIHDNTKVEGYSYDPKKAMSQVENQKIVQDAFSKSPDNPLNTMLKDVKGDHKQYKMGESIYDIPESDNHSTFEPMETRETKPLKGYDELVDKFEVKHDPNSNEKTTISIAENLLKVWWKDGVKVMMDDARIKENRALTEVRRVMNKSKLDNPLYNEVVAANVVEHLQNLESAELKILTDVINENFQSQKMQDHFFNLIKEAQGAPGGTEIPRVADVHKVMRSLPSVMKDNQGFFPVKNSHYIYADQRGLGISSQRKNILSNQYGDIAGKSVVGKRQTTLEGGVDINLKQTAKNINAFANNLADDAGIYRANTEEAKQIRQKIEAKQLQKANKEYNDMTDFIKKSVDTKVPDKVIKDKAKEFIREKEAEKSQSTKDLQYYEGREKLLSKSIETSKKKYERSINKIDDIDNRIEAAESNRERLEAEIVRLEESRKGGIEKERLQREKRNNTNQIRDAKSQAKGLRSIKRNIERSVKNNTIDLEGMQQRKHEVETRMKYINENLAEADKVIESIKKKYQPITDVVNELQDYTLQQAKDYIKEEGLLDLTNQQKGMLEYVLDDLKDEDLKSVIDESKVEQIVDHIQALTNEDKQLIVAEYNKYQELQQGYDLAVQGSDQQKAGSQASRVLNAAIDGLSTAQNNAKSDFRSFINEHLSKAVASKEAPPLGKGVSNIDQLPSNHKFYRDIAEMFNKLQSGEEVYQSSYADPYDRLVFQVSNYMKNHAERTNKIYKAAGIELDMADFFLGAQEHKGIKNNLISQQALIELMAGKFMIGDQVMTPEHVTRFYNDTKADKKSFTYEVLGKERRNRTINALNFEDAMRYEEIANGRTPQAIVEDIVGTKAFERSMITQGNFPQAIKNSTMRFLKDKQLILDHTQKEPIGLSDAPLMLQKGSDGKSLYSKNPNAPTLDKHLANVAHILNYIERADKSMSKNPLSGAYAMFSAHIFKNSYQYSVAATAVDPLMASVLFSNGSKLDTFKSAIKGVFQSIEHEDMINAEAYLASHQSRSITKAREYTTTDRINLFDSKDGIHGESTTGDKATELMHKAAETFSASTPNEYFHRLETGKVLSIIDSKIGQYMHDSYETLPPNIKGELLKGGLNERDWNNITNIMDDVRHQNKMLYDDLTADGTKFSEAIVQLYSPEIATKVRVAKDAMLQLVTGNDITSFPKSISRGVLKSSEKLSKETNLSGNLFESINTKLATAESGDSIARGMRYGLNQALFFTKALEQNPLRTQGAVNVAWYSAVAKSIAEDLMVSFFRMGLRSVSNKLEKAKPKEDDETFAVKLMKEVANSMTYRLSPIINVLGGLVTHGMGRNSQLLGSVDLDENTPLENSVAFGASTVGNYALGMVLGKSGMPVNTVALPTTINYIANEVNEYLDGILDADFTRNMQRAIMGHKVHKQSDNKKVKLPKKRKRTKVKQVKQLV